MIRLWLRFLTFSAMVSSPSFAQSVSGSGVARILSGEHADFTRLVIELPDDGGWTLGRTATGYAFASGAVSQPVYDLARVWDRIPRNRLQSLRVDPGSGALQISLACPCHVFPFEFRDGMVVLDIRNGPAPPGSAFEAPFASPEANTTTAMAPSLVPTAPAAYDWIEPARAGAGKSLPSALPLPLATGSAGLDPLRDELLRQISRGAADGVVEMELPGKPPVPKDTTALPVSGARIALGELTGLAILDGSEDPDDRQTDGTACLSDDILAVANWGADRPVLDLLAEARSGLFGEFDTVDPAAVQQSIKLHLYLGFGAEALQYAKFLPESEADGSPEPDTGLAPLLSMARLIEGEEDPATPFATMLGCDGAAALWAALAHSRLPAAAKVNTAAIVRSFQALPPHLRRLLGPGLAERLLERDANAARIIRDAMERTPDVLKGTVALLDAKADLEADRPEAALAHAEAALADGGVQSDGLIALVDAHFRSSLPLSPDVAVVLASLNRETGLDSGTGELHRALVLALALSGQLDEAFNLADPVATESADLWRVVAERAEDGALLAHAVRPANAALPPVASDVALALADRLAGLGFPEAALAWLGPMGPDHPAPQRMVAARAELARGDARRALQLLDGIDGPDALGTRIEAQTRLGALTVARKALEAAGQPEKAARLATWEEDWPRLQAEGEGPWADAAAFATAPAPQEPGPLARGKALLADSTATRVAIGVLLADIPIP